MISKPSATSQISPAAPAPIRTRGRVRPSEAQIPSSSGKASGISHQLPANRARGETPLSKPYHGRTSSPAHPVANQTARTRGEQIDLFGSVLHLVGPLAEQTSARGG